ncbi:SDR family oxidoreductase [Candidatus Pelagibacter ubique]|nr:SDR family oxidoreductase [Candidatus Pelagibacter ubique]
MKKILILGSEGFLGSVLVPHLINDGKIVVGVDKCFFGKNNIPNKNFTLYKKDYNHLPKKFFEDFEFIIDLVNISNDPASELNKMFTNTTNYLNKLKLYKKIENNKKILRYIYMSSCSVYGNNKNLISERSKPKPISLYSKLCLKYEEYLKKRNKIPFTIMRLGTLYGWSERMRYDIAINKIIRDMIFSKKIEILGGTQLRFFCHNQFACDVINQIITENKKQTLNKVFNIGNFNTNIIQLTKKILKLTKIKNVNIHHEINTIDKRSYEVSIKTAKKFQNKINLNKLTNESILKTFHFIKKDQDPFSKQKVTLNVYKDFLDKK